MTVMNKSSLERLCSGDKPLIRNAVDLGVQIQQNGIDITIKQNTEIRISWCNRFR